MSTLLMRLVHGGTYLQVPYILEKRRRIVSAAAPAASSRAGFSIAYPHSGARLLCSRIGWMMAGGFRYPSSGVSLGSL